MGGCKCAYRNCTVKTDGKTHMFHFPVFDKIRCHQWIMNAQRYEFLNLKVSQLRNRVICQHHFIDKYFMNFKKDKLACDAVPTIDGPYCDSSKWMNDNITDIPAIPLTPEDIENSNLSLIDKKANFSTKYADFLTNGDIDLPSNPLSYNITLRDMKIKPEVKYSDKLVFQTEPVKTSSKGALAVIKPYDQDNNQTELKQYNINNNKNDKPKLIEIEVENVAGTEKSNSVLPELCIISETDPSGNKITNDVQDVNKVSKNCVKSTPKKKQSKVKIISEKKIRNPISMPPNLRSVSPSLVINMPQKDILPKEEQYKPEVDIENISKMKIGRDGVVHEQNSLLHTGVTQQNCEQPTILYSINIEGQKQPLEIDSLPVNIYNPQENRIVHGLINNQNPENVPCYTIDVNLHKEEGQEPSYSFNFRPKADNSKKSVIKILKDQNVVDVQCENDKAQENNNPVGNRVSLEPELEKNTTEPLQTTPVKLVNDQTIAAKNKVNLSRLAAIEEKRKFNMKLRDAIENCLNNSNIQCSQKLKDSKETLLNKGICKKVDTSVKVSTHLSPATDNQRVQEFTLNVLESRLQQMENRLLNRIDQNTQRILELKSAVGVKAKTRSSSMQTCNEGNVESYKKYLYQEISKFLSPDCNSAVYEELFINKFSVDTKNKGSPKKRRKVR